MPVIFITGATSGFGAATARLFATNGWQVVATGRRLERLQALQAEFAEGRVHIAPMDLTQRQSIVDAVAALPDTHWMSLVDETRKGLQHLRTAAGYYLGCALLLIGGVFVWRYGLRRGFVIGLIPIGVIGAICLVYLVAQVPVTLFHVMAMFLVVGLGVDYQVFVAEMSGKEDSRHFANALMLSAATSSLSFGLLSLSVLPAVSAFGTTVMLGVWGNLIGGFCLISIWPTLTGKHNDP